jgi:predicted hydrolase (HD superfamily)
MIEKSNNKFKFKMIYVCTYEDKVSIGGKVSAMGSITRDEALALLGKYNKDPFHIRHALTVEAVMKWFARELGYENEEEYWGIVGLLHDIDFEMYPDEHCLKAPELLREAGVGEDLIRSVVFPWLWNYYRCFSRT